MTPHRALMLTLAAMIASLLLPACGGEGNAADSTPAEATPSPAAIAAANANCRHFLRETRRIGREALHNEPPATTLEMTTERLVKPSIPLLETIADRQQALEKKAHSPVFSLYANLFDPIIVLAQNRLRTGRAEDYTRSKQIEERLTDLGLEQRHFARLANLPDCDLDFQHILLESLNE
jgi:hypothetical protein